MAGWLAQRRDQFFSNGYSQFVLAWHGLRVDEAVLLIFRAEETLKAGMLAAHKTRGPGHFALGIPAESLIAWREHLRLHGIEIEKEIEWPRGGKSLYLRDPAGNSVELVTRGLRGLPSGW
jgi:catechol 2,3-dioxygenase-like lactoylglutathione lyase family enzyme